MAGITLKRQKSIIFIELSIRDSSLKLLLLHMEGNDYDKDRIIIIILTIVTITKIILVNYNDNNNLTSLIPLNKINLHHAWMYLK